MAEILGDGFVINVDAKVGVDVDATAIKNLAKTFGASFGGLARGLGDPLRKTLDAMDEDLKRVLGPEAARRIINDFTRGFDTGFSGMADNARREYSNIGEAATEASKQTRGAFDGSEREARQTAGAAQDVADALRTVLAEAKGLEGPFIATLNAINAEFKLLRGEVSKSLVDEQSQQQARRIAEREQERLLQQEKEANRERLAQSNAFRRAEEQQRQAGYRTQIVERRAALAQENIIQNAALQEQLTQERGAQQRRTAIVRAGLQATRSLYQSTGSGLSSVISSLYAKMRSDTEVGEAQLSSVQRAGLNRRESQLRSSNAQQIAQVRRQQGVYLAAQQQLDRGVLGAVAGTSAAGAGFRGLAVGAAGAFGIAALVKEASGFEANLRVFRELNEEVQQSDKLFQQLRQTALDLGNDAALPGVSAADAADALTALAKTGLDVSDSIDASRGSLLLARVAGVDFAESARTIGSTLNALNLEGSDAIKVVDGLAAALRFSGGASFDELRQGQQQALLVFRGAFAGAEEPLEIMNNLNASLALFSQNALRGSDAGTSLKTFIQSLPGRADQSKGIISELLADIGESGNFLFDAAGNARTFAETIDLVRRGFLNLDPAARADAVQRIFGSDAARAAEIFINTTGEDLDKLVADVADAEGLTLRLAEAQNQGLIAAADALVSTIETIFINLFSVVDIPLGKFVSAVADTIGALASAPQFTILRQALFGIAAGLLAIAAAKAGIEAFRLLTTVLLPSFLSPMGLAVIAAAALGGAFVVLFRNSEAFRDALGGGIDVLKDLAGTVSETVGPVIEDYIGRAGEFFGDLALAIQEVFNVLLRGDFQGVAIDAFGWFEDSAFTDQLLAFRDTALTVFSEVPGIVTDAFSVVRDAFGSLFDLIQGLDFTGVFSGITDAATTAFDTIRDAIGVVASFIGATFAVIQVDGVFEGLRQAAVFAFSGIIDAAAFILSPIGDLIGSFFASINWPAVGITVLTGIYEIFRAIGRAVGAFVGSDQFLATLGIALATIASVLGSAASGLVVGLIDGLTNSDMGQRIGEFLVDAFREGIDAAFSLLASTINPATLIKQIFTDPFSAALGVLVTTVTALLGVRLLKVFAKFGSGLRDQAINFRLAAQTFSRGLGGVDKNLESSKGAFERHELAVRNTNRRFGPVAGLVARVGDSFNRMNGRVSQSATGFETLRTSQQRAVQQSLGGFVPAMAQTETAVQRVESRLGNLAGTFSALAGGAAVGFGIGRALTADDPIGVVGNIGVAIGGLVPIVQGTQAAIAASGLTAGLLTGGLALAVTAIVGAVTYFATRGNDAKQAAEDVAEASKQYVTAFTRIIETTNGAANQTSLEFFRQLRDTSDDTFAAFRDAVGEFELDFKTAARALTGSEAAYKAWGEEARSQLRSATEEVAALEAEERRLARRGGQEFADFSGRLDAARAERDLLKESFGVVEDTRAAFEEALSLSAEELVIRREFKQLEDERKNAAQLALDLKREERDAQNEIAQSLRDTIELEQGRTQEDSARRVRQGLRGVADSLKGGEGLQGVADLQEFLDGEQTAGADRAADSLRGVSDVIEQIVVGIADSSTTQKEFNDRLALTAIGYQNLLTEAGVSEELAGRIIASIIDPFKEAQPFSIAFFARIKEDLGTLKTDLRDSNLTVEVFADLNSTPANDALREFIDNPTEKSVQGLLDLGIPEQKIATFIAEPTAKNLEAILTPNSLTQAREQLAPLVAAEEKNITLVTRLAQNPNDLLSEAIGGSINAVVGVDDSTAKDAIGNLKGSVETPFTSFIDLRDDEARRTVTELDAFVRENVKDPAIDLNDQDARDTLQIFYADLIERGVINIPVGLDFGPARRDAAANKGILPGISAFFPNIGNSKMGRIVTEPMLSWLGEEKRKEVVVPLTMPSRAVQLSKESGLIDLLARQGALPQASALEVKLPSSSPDTAEMRTMVREMRALRQEIMENDRATYQISGAQSPREVEETIRRKRRRRRLGVK